MNKDVLKYALMAVGAYLIYRYVESQGGFSALLGTTAAAAPTPAPAPPTYTYNPAPPLPVPTATPILDMTGLTVVRDINNSFTGTVKINGVPTRLAIIQTDGRIFNTSGQEVTSQLAAMGVDINALRAAFAQAGAGLAGFAPASYRPSNIWLN